MSPVRAPSNEVVELPSNLRGIAIILVKLRKG
jgi:hypothetical protein